MVSSILTFRVHAIQRMFQRNIRVDDVLSLLKDGDVIESYPNDNPYPSRLILGWCGSRPLHAVVAYNDVKGENIVITVYEPALHEWEQGFRERRR